MPVGSDDFPPKPLAGPCSQQTIYLYTTAGLVEIRLPPGVMAYSTQADGPVRINIVYSTAFAPPQDAE